MNQDKIYEIVEQIQSISKLMNKRVSNKAKCKKFTINALMIINQLRLGNVKTLTEISDTLGIPNSTVSVIVDRLVKLGIVRRERDQLDRRKVHIYIVNEGLEQEEQIIKYQIDYFGDLFKDASYEEIDSILRGLKTLEEVIKKNSP